MDSTARAWASRSKAHPNTNPFYLRIPAIVTADSGRS
jgi:hypothetical protein